MEYLSKEEQFKKILNNGEIPRIEDYELRELRWKYWNLRHDAFLDEHGVKDSELGEVWDKLYKEEMKEIEEYKIRKGIVERFSKEKGYNGI